MIEGVKLPATVRVHRWPVLSLDGKRVRTAKPVETREYGLEQVIGTKAYVRFPFNDLVAFNLKSCQTSLGRLRDWVLDAKDAARVRRALKKGEADPSPRSAES